MDLLKIWFSEVPNVSLDLHNQPQLMEQELAF